jgi:hypothetical protein
MVSMLRTRERHTAQRLLEAQGRIGTARRQGERQVLQLVGPAERIRLQRSHVARECAEFSQPASEVGE